MKATINLHKLGFPPQKNGNLMTPDIWQPWISDKKKSGWHETLRKEMSCLVDFCKFPPKCGVESQNQSESHKKKNKKQNDLTSSSLQISFLLSKMDPKKKWYFSAVALALVRKCSRWGLQRMPQSCDAFVPEQLGVLQKKHSLKTSQNRFMVLLREVHKN